MKLVLFLQKAVRNQYDFVHGIKPKEIFTLALVDYHVCISTTTITTYLYKINLKCSITWWLNSSRNFVLEAFVVFVSTFFKFDVPREILFYLVFLFYNAICWVAQGGNEDVSRERLQNMVKTNAKAVQLQVRSRSLPQRSHERENLGEMPSNASPGRNRKLRVQKQSVALMGGHLHRSWFFIDRGPQLKINKLKLKYMKNFRELFSHPVYGEYRKLKCHHKCPSRHLAHKLLKIDIFLCFHILSTLFSFCLALLKKKNWRRWKKHGKKR